MNPQPLPPELQNWRVTEVEGESTPVTEDTAQTGSVPDDRKPGISGRELTDLFDDELVLTLAERKLSIAYGETGAVNLSLLNNGSRPQVFELTVQGQAHAGWFPELPLRIPLQPGERTVFAVQVEPPANPSTEAGEYPFGVTACSAERPERRSRAVCVLTIEPHSEFRLGMLQPGQVMTSWWAPSAHVVLPVTNFSNHRADFQVVAADQARESIFEFETPRDIYPQVGQAAFALEPGERASIGISILSRRQSVLSFGEQARSFRVAVQLVEGSVQEGHLEHRQVVEGRIGSAALIGPWQLVTLGGIATVVLVVLMLTSAAMLMALRTEESPPPATPVSPPAPAFALVLSMDQPLPENQAPAADPVATQPAATAAVPAATVIGPDGLPVVQADQISAPGEAVPAPPPVVRPTPVAVVPPSSGGMTYAQMFQQIASRYDLNWKMLAAQGYVESGFDSSAIGTQGSLGIMQVHPDTWQEWAPRVDVTDAFDTYSNVLVAAIYLDYLRVLLGQQGRPQVEWMLAAYNWGPDKVLDVIGGGGGWTDLPVEVQKYATEVLRIAQSIPDN